jgi:hypothetical protein
MSTICSSARAVAAVVEEEEEEAVVEKAEAVAEVVAVEAAAVEAVAVAAVVKVALEALAVRMFPPRMDTLNVLDALHHLGTLGLLSTPTSSCPPPMCTSDLTITTVEIDLPAPTSVAQLVEEADPDHSTAAASSTAVARELLTPPVLEAP